MSMRYSLTAKGLSETRAVVRGDDGGRRAEKIRREGEGTPTVVVEKGCVSRGELWWQRCKDHSRVKSQGVAVVSGRELADASSHLRTELLAAPSTHRTSPVRPSPTTNLMEARREM